MRAGNRKDGDSRAPIPHMYMGRTDLTQPRELHACRRRKPWSVGPMSTFRQGIPLCCGHDNLSLHRTAKGRTVAGSHNTKGIMFGPPMATSVENASIRRSIDANIRLIFDRCSLGYARTKHRCSPDVRYETVFVCAFDASVTMDAWVSCQCSCIIYRRPTPIFP